MEIDEKIQCMHEIDKAGKHLALNFSEDITGRNVP